MWGVKRRSSERDEKGLQGWSFKAVESGTKGKVLLSERGVARKVKK